MKQGVVGSTSCGSIFSVQILDSNVQTHQAQILRYDTDYHTSLIKGRNVGLYTSEESKIDTEKSQSRKDAFFLGIRLWRM